MRATLMDGKAIASELEAELGSQIVALSREAGRPPGLTVILVGEDPASKVYVRNKEKACERLGIRSEILQLPTASTRELESLIMRLNEDPDVDGILVQLPLPDSIDSQRILEVIAPAKDVDGFHPWNMGKLLAGTPEMVPCTPAGVMELLRRYEVPLRGAEAVVVGRSTIVGRPLASLLLAADATVTVAHSRTRDLAVVLRRADIVVAAVGRPELITGEMIKPGAAVVDVGINRVGDRLVGDVAFADVSEIAAHITPVPGGVGPMTIAMLLGNTVASMRRTLERKAHV